MKWNNHPFVCPECDGEGEVECCCCDNETECEACNGTGLDDDRIDVAAFTAAVNELHEGAPVGVPMSWEWIDPATGAWLGRESPAGRVAYADFARKTEGPT